MDNPVKPVIDTIENVAEKVINEAIKQTEITSKELLGDIKPLSEEELKTKQTEDEKKKQEEMNRLRKEMGQGRNVGEEIERIHREKEQKEEQATTTEAKAAEGKRVEEPVALDVESSNPAKKKKSRGSAFAGKKKKSQPDQSQMSQTQEFKGKID